MFETLITMLRTLETVGDADFDIEDDGSVDVTFNDFDGFDDDWSEVMRDYKMPELVDKAFDLLESCDHDDDFYITYMVDGHAVRVGFTSYDI